ncbi:hypothetical protein C1H76_1686 [Elsinoe australis]|uniref:WW domain-containing protein n=1 Tax=Elsinoe australis TaxID=40998 RepID=A0A4U7B401_9PEZI|nr:hypothetical protein C1H76_1686 [Elsinoe australis]
MSSHAVPEDAPPSYDAATAASSTFRPSQNIQHNANHLQVPEAPRAARKSMEDEHRPLPRGWVRQWDTKEHHQFFVDTKADPPRSIWIHPLDDPETLQSLSSEERERLQDEEERMRRSPSPNQQNFPDLPQRPSGSHEPTHAPHKRGLGERIADTVTGTTKEERDRHRAQREEEERQYLEMHARFRTALHRAQVTGQPQFLAKDRDGHDVYIEPPQMAMGMGGYPGGYGPRQYGYDPYTHGPYSSPDARFVRPNYAYGRPGYGGGLGLPLAGGMLGGLMLGGLLT